MLSSVHFCLTYKKKTGQVYQSFDFLFYKVVFVFVNFLLDKTVFFLCKICFSLIELSFCKGCHLFAINYAFTVFTNARRFLEESAKQPIASTIAKSTSAYKLYTSVQVSAV